MLRGELMGVLDKIKNALFEVEYVEVDEPPVKEKKPKFMDKLKERKSDEDKPIAKKIVLPGKKEDKVEEIHEEDLKTDNYEARPIDETPKEEKHESFKMLDDNDFMVDSDYDKVVPAVANQQINDNVEPKRMRREDIMSSKYEEVSPVQEEKVVEQYATKKTEVTYSTPTHESKPYGVDNSYNVPVHEYGTYEKKEEKTYFKPSPIISPIYGILDKNYKKEDVVQKKEIRLSTNYSRGNVSVDDVRNKAYGERKSRENHVDEKPVETKFEVEEEEDDNLLVDLSDKAKPEVKELTMGDALEYFQDLGLEYNVDYVDVSKQKVEQTKHVEKLDEEIIENSDRNTSDMSKMERLEEKEEKEEKSSKPKIHSHVDTALEDDIQDVIEDNYDKPRLTSTIEVKDESTSNTEALDDDDNLFDLIDSMYQENE